MKTKAYSKEGLSAASKLDPKEKEKVEVCDFLSNMVEELERQVETTEAEAATLQAGLKKGKKDNAKAERIAELERMAERHQWHIGKLELVRRSLENDGVEVEQVKDLEESIRYYVENNQEVDFMEDDSLYDDLNLAEGEDLYGMTQDMDKVSSQDTQSIQDDTHEEPVRNTGPSAAKAKAPEASTASARRPSTQLKSPLPTLSTLHTPAQAATNGTSGSTMKPAPLPTRAPGEPLKYASAAAAAAASDRNNVGIAPLPPPPGAIHVNHALRSSAASSPAVSHAQLATSHAANQRPSAASAASQDGATPITAKSPALSHSSAAPASTEASSIPPTPAQEKRSVTPAKTSKPSEAVEQPLTNGDKPAQLAEESVYHLPSSLQDLLESFEATKEDALSSHADERLLVASHSSHPESVDADKPRHYRPQNPYPYTPAHYPQEPLSIFDDPRLYSRVDTDSLFYAFYYRQGTYEQYLAAKALKSQSWRFHKQYQTWFQRHEEPKSITEDYEQGTYRFFDYESTW